MEKEDKDEENRVEYVFRDADENEDKNLFKSYSILEIYQV